MTLQQVIHDHAPQVKSMIDWASISTLLATLAGLLPHVATLFTVIWAILRVYEMKTVQRWLRKKRRRK